MKNSKSKFKISDGFTLLEMLVVLGIIMIVMGITAVSYSTTQKKTRDSKRKTDLKNIQNSMEQYFSICSYTYPTPASGKVPPVVCTSPASSLMPTVPVDPKTGEQYTMTGDGSNYTICIPTRAATPPVFETENVTNYCITNQQ